MSQGWIGLGDSAFAGDGVTLLDGARATVGAGTGWFLDAPREVAFDRDATLPVVLARRLSLLEDGATNGAREATLVAARLDDGAVYVGNAFEPLDLPSAAVPWVDPATLPDDGARICGAERIDARARLPRLPWREGTLVLRALVGARTTAPVTVRLRRAVPFDDDVAALLDARRAVGFPRAVWPPRSASGDAPYYRPGSRSPRVPSPEGLALTAHADGAHAMLWGTLRTTPRPREIVRPDDPSETRYAAMRGASHVDVGAPGAVAVIPVTLVARHAALAEALHWAMQVPCFPETARSGGVLEGYFGIDARTLPGLPPLDGPWTFWAVCGAHLAGPLRVG